MFCTEWTQHKSTPWFQVVIKSKLTLEYFYKYGTADTLVQEIFNFLARRQRTVQCKMALTSQQRSWCVPEFHKTVLWLCRVGEWKSACHSGDWTWLSNTQCVLCRIKADCVRPVHLWGTNLYWPKLPGNANQLVESKTSCWETWPAFLAIWGAAALASRCPHVSQRALAKQMDWPRWTRWPGVLQVAPEITGPDRLWLFSFRGTWRTGSMYLHYQQPWMSCRNASQQL